MYDFRSILILTNAFICFLLQIINKQYLFSSCNTNTLWKVGFYILLTSMTPSVGRIGVPTGSNIALEEDGIPGSAEYNVVKV